MLWNYLNIPGGKMKIISVIDLPKELQRYLEEKGELLLKRTPTKEEVKEAEIIIGNIDRSLLSYGQRLKYVQLESAGSDTYVPFLNKDCVLCNASGTFGANIAEHLIMCVLMLFRHMPSYGVYQKQHQFQPILHNRMIADSCFMIVGCGDLGTQLAKRIKALGGKTIGVKRTLVSKLPYFDEVYTISDFPSLIKKADAIILCLPNNRGSDHLINTKTLAMMKKEAILLNVGRGNAVDEIALYYALKERRIAGAALDVFAEEPLSENSPLWDLDNIIITPHVAGTFANEYTKQLFVSLLSDNLHRYFEGKPLRNVVDREWGY